MSAEEIRTDTRARWVAYVRYRTQTGGYKQMLATGSTKGAARRSLDRKINRTHQSIDASGDLDASTTVERLASLWLAERREKGLGRHQTLVKYEREITTAIVPQWGGLSIGETSTARLHRGLSQIEQGRSSRQTRTVLSQLFGYAVALGALQSNPMRGLPSESTPRSRRKKRRTHPRSLTPDETDAVLAAVRRYEEPNPKGGARPSGSLSLAVEIMLSTGCRIGECLALTWADTHLDDDEPWLRIAATLVEPAGKGDPALHRQEFTKGDREDDEEPGRDVGIPTATAALLRAHRRRTAYRRPADPVLANRSGRWLWPSNVRSMLRTAVGRHAPTVHDLHPHLFRSTVATVVSDVYGVEVAQEMLGHSSAQTTARYYVAKKRRVVRGQDAVATWRARGENATGALGAGSTL